MYVYGKIKYINFNLVEFRVGVYLYYWLIYIYIDFKVEFVLRKILFEKIIKEKIF